MKRLSKINETIFGDMIKRSYKSDEVRKEDNVNFLGVDEFIEYLQNRYVFKNQIMTNKYPRYTKIEIDFHQEPNKIQRATIVIDFNNNSDSIVDVEIFTCFCPDNIRNELIKKFPSSVVYKSSIILRNEDLTNQTIVDILDIIISINAPGCLIYKKTNETIFGDMLKRSYKEDEMRKEDEINGGDELYDYIDDNYIVTDDDYNIRMFSGRNENMIIITISSHIEFHIIYGKNDKTIFRIRILGDHTPEVEKVKEEMISKYNFSGTPNQGIIIKSKNKFKEYEIIEILDHLINITPHQVISKKS